MRKTTAFILSLSLVASAVLISGPDISERISAAEKVSGDLNGDGVIDSTDLRSMFSFFFGTQKESSSEIPDINGDGKVSILDCIGYRRKAVQTQEMKDFTVKDGVLVKYTGRSKVVEIPENVTAIADRAFWSNQDIEAVYIPGTVKTIGDSVFWSCSALEFIDIAEGVEELGTTICWSCAELKDVNLPSTIKKYSQYDTFGTCEELKLHIPAGSENSAVGKIAKSTHYSGEYGTPVPCDNTPAQYQPRDKSRAILAEQYSNGKFTEFIIPEGTDFIGANAFEYCKMLKSVFIPESVKEIAGEAFEYCEGLTQVYIAEGCEKLGDGAFEYCRALTDITIPASVKSMRRSTLNYCSPSLTVHCPAGSYAESFAKEYKIKYDNNVDSPENTDLLHLQ